MKNKFLIFILLLSFVYTGCVNIHPIMISQETKRFQEITLSKNIVYSGLLDDHTVLFYRFVNRDAVYYAYNFDTKEKIKLGVLENHCLDTGSTVLLNNQLYFYVGVAQGEHLKNVLCRINPEKNT